jgi:hypothetical protein
MSEPLTKADLVVWALSVAILFAALLWPPQ